MAAKTTAATTAARADPVRRASRAAPIGPSSSGTTTSSRVASAIDPTSSVPSSPSSPSAVGCGASLPRPARRQPDSHSASSGHGRIGSWGRSTSDGVDAEEVVPRPDGQDRRSTTQTTTVVLRAPVRSEPATSPADRARARTRSSPPRPSWPRRKAAKRADPRAWRRRTSLSGTARIAASRRRAAALSLRRAPVPPPGADDVGGQPAPAGDDGVERPRPRRAGRPAGRPGAGGSGRSR